VTAKKTLVLCGLVVLGLMLWFRAPRHTPRKNYNELKIQRALGEVYETQLIYRKVNGRYGNLAELTDRGDWLDPSIAEAQTPQESYRGYIFRDIGEPSEVEFCIGATPELYDDTGNNSFYVDQTGKIFFQDLGAAWDFNSILIGKWQEIK